MAGTDKESLKKTNSKKAWGGRFGKETDKFFQDFQASISFDKKLYKQDIVGSACHARMLKSIGILSEDELKTILSGLKSLLDSFDKELPDFDSSLEDIHMAVESELGKLIGPLAGKVHTARSRNDQVATDFRMYLREAVLDAIDDTFSLIDSLLVVAEKNKEVILPGYTHLQRAQPVLFSFHMLAYVQKFLRDVQRFLDIFPRINISPLGSGALAGTTFNIDRELTAKLLKFSKSSENAMDSVSDRDYLLEFLSCASIVMIHLSRISEEIILWCTGEFKFVELDDAYSTGSSIMPQKKNPDVQELVRGKSGRVIGSLIGLLTAVKGLPLAYNKDLQEDKEGVFDVIETLSGSTLLTERVLSTMTLNSNNMRYAAVRGFSNATDLADYLVLKGIPFREAHEIVGKAVRFCVESQCGLEDLSLEQYKQFTTLADNELYSFLKLENVVNKRSAKGGTALSEVERQINYSRNSVNKFKKIANDYREAIALDLNEIFNYE